MRRCLSALALVVCLPAFALAASDLDRILTLPSQPSMTKAPRVAVQSPGEPFARQIPFWRAVQDVLQSSEVEISSNATTATALAANGSNCSSGSFAAGVDASGNAEGCTAPGSGGIGTVTSVAVAGNDGLSVSGSPITTSGTITLDLSGSTPSRCARWDGSGNLVASSGDCTAGDTDTDTTCLDAGVSCLFAGSASEGGPATTALVLNANGSNCSAGQYARGVDAAGNAESCTADVDTDTTCLDAGVSCLFAGSASEGGPATTALALNANPTACTGTQKVTDIAADGTLTCGADIDTDTDTTCNDVAVSCLFAGSASEGGAATSALTSTNADNLTLDPSDCSANTFATSIDRQADLTCASITDADVPNTITVDLAATATALAANGTNCTAGNYPLGVNTSGAVESCTADDDAPECADLPAFTGDVTNVNCAMTIPANAVAFSELSGTATDAQIPNTITVDNATNADAVDIAAESTDTTSFPLIADSAGSGTSQTPRTDNGLTYNANTNALGTTSLTLSSLTSGRVALVGASGLLTDDAGILYDATANSLTIDQLNLSSGDKIRFDDGTGNEYSLFRNASNDIELRRNIGGAAQQGFLFSSGYLGISQTVRTDLGQSTNGFSGIYVREDGVAAGVGTDTARIVAPALSGNITLTLPAATGTLARTDGDAIGQTTAAAGTFTALRANSSINLGGIELWDTADGVVKFVRHPSMTENSITLATGTNNNVATSDIPFQIISGPTGGFTITGFTAPTTSRKQGALLYVYNSTTQAMTIANQNASSTAANRIITMTGADVTTTAAGGAFAVFIYSNTDSRWLLVSVQG